MRCKFLVFFLFVFLGNVYSIEIPERTKKEYALKFHEAFVLQSVGNSTVAFNRFLEAFRLGTNAGESPKKLQVIADLFYWYRQHGSCMKLFGKQLSHKERIDGEYCACGKRHEYDEGTIRFSRAKPILAAPQHHLGVVLATIPDYQSEYGTNPRQAGTVRKFMFGVGEIIAGVFGYVVGYRAGGLSLVAHGGYLIIDELNTLWIEHEVAIYELKKLTDQAEALSKD